MRPRGRLDINRSGSSRDEIAWMCFAGIYVLGLAAHVILSRYGDWYHWAVVMACIPVATALLAWRIWELMGPRRRVERENVTAVMCAAGVGAFGTVVFSWSWTWLIVYVVFGITAVSVFNMQESRRVKGDGHDGHTVKGVDPEALGLAPGTTMRRKDDTVVVDHKDGQTVDDVRANLKAWASRFKLPFGSLIAHAGRHAGETVVKVVDTTTLDKPIPFTPPTPPATVADALSITDPIEIGTYMDGVRASADYSEGHELSMGVTGSGKSVREQLLAGLMLTRRDVCVLWCDPVAGPQSAGPVLDGVTWAAADMAEAKALVAGLVRATTARIGLLASLRDSHGEPFVKWTADAFDLHGVPQLQVFCDEAEWMIDNPSIVKVVEQARKSGIRMRFSLPRASHSRMETDVRAQLARRTCFGVMAADDAGFVLPSDVIEAGASPEAWRSDFPGRHISVAPGIPRDRLPMPILTDMPTRDGGKTLDLSVVRDMVRDHAHVRARLDTVTADALGPAFALASNGDRDRVVRDQVPVPRATVVMASRDQNGAPGHDQGGRVATAVRGQDSDQTDDLDTRDMTSDDFEGLPMPDLTGIDLTGIDPTADDTDPSADGVDLGDLTGSRLSTSERNARFLGMLMERYEECVNRGRPPMVSRKELSNAWHEIPGGGGKPWPYYRLGRLAAQMLVQQDAQDEEWFHFVSDPRTWDAGATTCSDDDGLGVDAES